LADKHLADKHLADKHLADKHLVEHNAISTTVNFSTRLFVCVDQMSVGQMVLDQKTRNYAKVKKKVFLPQLELSSLGLSHKTFYSCNYFLSIVN
jgi:hypothetical protein